MIWGMVLQMQAWIGTIPAALKGKIVRFILVSKEYTPVFVSIVFKFAP